MAPALSPFDELHEKPEEGVLTARLHRTQLLTLRPPQDRTNSGDLEEMSRLKKRVAELEKSISSLAASPSGRKKV